jgi:hypothetical protein
MGAAMTKSELRKMRKVARATGKNLASLDREQGPQEFTETNQGYRARERWARRYDALDGAPESNDDR